MSREKKYFERNKAGKDTSPVSGGGNCMCMDVGGGKFRCFKMVLGNWQDCGYGEFDSLDECRQATGCKAGEGC